MPKTLVHAASPIAIEHRLSAVANRLRRWGSWLGYRHTYNSNVVKKLGNKRDIDGPKLGEYIACSAPLHLADGWNYLSRAFDAACRGDRSSAYHLAYYGELRATMSLLATEGIGIFNRRHIALNEHLEPTEFKRNAEREHMPQRGRCFQLGRVSLVDQKDCCEPSPSNPRVYPIGLQLWESSNRTGGL